MKNLNQFIIEKLKGSTLKKDQYNYFPETKEELKKILKDRLDKDPNANLNDINVSNITDMSYLFKELNPHNIDISIWDVSNVKNMEFMFQSCYKFNSDLSYWNVSKVIDMDAMFYNCENFNGIGLEKWKTSKVNSMKYIFYKSGVRKKNQVGIKYEKFKSIYTRKIKRVYIK